MKTIATVQLRTAFTFRLHIHLSILIIIQNSAYKVVYPKLKRQDRSLTSDYRLLYRLAAFTAFAASLLLHLATFVLSASCFKEFSEHKLR